MTDVKGYTPLTDEQKAFANEGKELEERVMRWLDQLEKNPQTLIDYGAKKVEIAGVDKRALALGRTNIQQGFMWAIRSIFQPQRIKLPEDDA